jgi:hypothetical protein
MEVVEISQPLNRFTEPSASKLVLQRKRGLKLMIIFMKFYNFTYYPTRISI